MILPIAFTPRHKHQSVRPQGLILDAPYVSTLEAEDHVVYTKNTLSTHNAEDFDGQLCEISISHDGDVATAVALVPTTRSLPDVGSPEASSVEDDVVHDGISNGP
jgi:holo-[acyl-carrier protein] synthase